MTDYATWVDSIIKKANRLSIVFLQLGAAHEPGRRALEESRFPIVTVDSYLKNARPESSETIVLDQVETLLDPQREGLLGTLRERVFSDVDAGMRVVLVSRSPRAAFPAVPGSSLLDDASFVHGPLSEPGDLDKLPTCVVDGVDPVVMLVQALRELGPEVCASLDRVIYEDMLIGEVALGLLTARELEALDGAGLTTLQSGQRSWNFPKYLMPLKRALDTVLGSPSNPQPQLGDVSRGLWTIERLLRHAIRERAITAWGDQWKTRSFDGELAREILSRAKEAAYMGATTIKQIRDPLEWMSLGELLGLKDKNEIGNLGLEPALWRQFRAQIMPIRNRLAHMRTLHPEDAADVVKWLRVLELRLAK